MFKPYFSNILSKSGATPKSAKKSFAYGLFKQHYWYPQAIGVDSNIESSASRSGLDESKKLGDTFELKKIQSTIGNLNRLEAKLSQINDTSSVNARASHTKLIERHNLTDLARASEKKFAQDKEEKSHTFNSKEFEIYSNFEDYLSSINPAWTLSEIPGIKSFDERIDVLFLGLMDIELKDSGNMPLAPFSLVKSDQDILGKMISSIGLDQGHFLRSPTVRGHQALEHALNVIKYFKPKVVVTMGAAATNIFFDTRIRLSNVHGDIQVKSFKIKDSAEVLSVNIFPLFHPDLLEINVSMKKTAWIDLQRLRTILDSGSHS